MTFFAGFLTFVLVLDCVILILLILIQLPKKEAGIGQAFGGAATDALFGAGSGTALTKMTKWAAGVFFGITFLLAVLNANAAKSRAKSFENEMKRAGLPATEAPAAPTTTKAAPTAPPVATSNLPSNMLLLTATNAANKVLEDTNLPSGTANAASNAPAAGTNKLAPPQPK